MTGRALRVAVVATLASAIVYGCGTTDIVRTTTVVTSIPGRTFIDLVPEVPVSLDDTGTPDSATATISPNWAGELVRPARTKPGADVVLPADDAVVPYLATSWTTEPGGDVVFQLRAGVRGPTGHVMTPQDVRWSFERAVARNPEAPFLFTLAHIDLANPVTILGARSVRINVSAPSPFALSLLASPTAQILDRRLFLAHASASDPWALGWAGTHSGGYAAYYVERDAPRQEVVLAATPGYWRPPYYQHVVIRAESSSGDRVGAVLDGSATHASGLGWSDYGKAVTLGDTEGVSASILQDGPAVITWHLNVSHGPLANPLVREAINLGINRPELADALDGSNDSPTTQPLPAAFGQAQPATFDPVQARSLMRAAGYANGAAFDVYTDDTLAGSQISTLVKLIYNQMLQIGVTIHTVYVDNPDQLLALERRGQSPSTIEVDQPLLGGAAFLLEQNANAALDPVSPAAENGYHSSTLQSVLDQLRSSPAGAGADALITQAATILNTDLPAINLVTVPVQSVTRSNVTGYSAYTEPITYYEYLRPS